MAAQPADPFAADSLPVDPLATMSWRHRVGLQRRLKRAWRQGMAQQRAVALHGLRSELSGVPILAVDCRSPISEITFADGTVIRLWLSHRPSVKALRTAVREGPVVMSRADDHGHCWALYFATADGRRPLMCRDLKLRPAQGGLPGRIGPRVSPQLV
jgi:hypothetical protein